MDRGELNELMIFLETQWHRYEKDELNSPEFLRRDKIAEAAWKVVHDFVFGEARTA